MGNGPAPQPTKASSRGGARGGTSRGVSPMEVLNAARRAVPAVDYALGAPGIAAAGALVVGFLGKGRTAVIIFGGMLVAMVLLFVFARLVSAQNPAITTAGIVLLWFVTLSFCAALVFTITAVAFAWPPAFLPFFGLEPRESGLATPIQELAKRINYGDVVYNRQAIDSLVGMAMVTRNAKERDGIVGIFKEKLKRPSSKDYDTVGRGVRRALLEAIVKVRN